MGTGFNPVIDLIGTLSNGNQTHTAASFANGQAYALQTHTIGSDYQFEYTIDVNNAAAGPGQANKPYIQVTDRDVSHAFLGPDGDYEIDGVTGTATAPGVGDVVTVRAILSTATPSVEIYINSVLAISGNCAGWTAGEVLWLNVLGANGDQLTINEGDPTGVSHGFTMTMPAGMLAWAESEAKITKYDTTTIPGDTAFTDGDATITHIGAAATIIVVTGAPKYTSGKYVIEYTYKEGADNVGIPAEWNPTVEVRNSGSSQPAGRRQADTVATIGTTPITGLTNVVNDDVITFAVDLDGLTTEIFRNGVSEATGSWTLSGEVEVWTSLYTPGDSVTVNGAGPFAIALPAGYSPWDGATATDTLLEGDMVSACLDLSADYIVAAYNALDGTLLATDTVSAGVLNYSINIGSFSGDVIVVGHPVLTSSAGKIVSKSVTV